MSDLKYTELRHRMLAAIADGKVDLTRMPGGRIRYIADTPMCGVSQNAIRYLVSHGAAVVDRNTWTSSAPMTLGMIGRKILAAWDAEHGKVDI
jgi:hypothetical protein